NPSLEQTNQVLELTSLNSNAGQPARLANLNYSNIVANTNRSAQNAVANQQAHAQVALSVTGKTANKVQNLGPLEARGSVDVLTSNALADTIASLKSAIAAFLAGGGGGSGGGGGGGSGTSALRHGLSSFYHELERIKKHNDRLQGSGTLFDPYVITDGGPLY